MFNWKLNKFIAEKLFKHNVIKNNEGFFIENKKTQKIEPLPDYSSNVDDVYKIIYFFKKHSYSIQLSYENKEDNIVLWKCFILKDNNQYSGFGENSVNLSIINAMINFLKSKNIINDNDLINIPISEIINNNEEYDLENHTSKIINIKDLKK